MPDREHITVVDAYGGVVDAIVSPHDEHSVQVSAPGYISRRVVLDFNPGTADVVLLIIDPSMAKGPELDDAAEANLTAASKAVFVASVSLGYWFSCQVIQPAQDRIYVTVPRGGALVNVLDRTGVFRRVPSKLHKPHEEGFEVVGSWKTRRGAPDLQVTMWRCESSLMVNTEGYAKPISSSWEYVAELDIDLQTGSGHVFEVARNHLTGSKTHPYLVNQALSWKWGIVPFRLEAGVEKEESDV